MEDIILAGNAREILSKLQQIEENFEAKFDSIDGKFELNNVEIKEIISAIKGNSLTQQGGIVQNQTMMRESMSSLEKRMSQVEDYQKGQKTAWITICLVCASVGTAVGLLIAFLSLLKK